MTTRIAASVLAVLVVVAVRTASAQTSQAAKAAPPQGCVPTPAVLKKAALDAATASTDTMTVLRALDKVASVPGFNSTNILMTIYDSDELSIYLAPPYWAFRFAVAEAMRKREPLAGIDVPTNVRLTVSPSQIDAPNISKVIVERNGKPVPSLANLLKPTAFTTRLGAKSVLNSGSVLYSCAAFAPGARVTVTAIPDSGSNIEKSFTTRELATITGGKYTAAMAIVSGDLIGFSTSEVRAVLGEPQEVAGARWTYQNDDVGFYLDTDGDKVIDARRDNSPLETLKLRR